MTQATALALSAGAALAEAEDLRWLPESSLPLDWNGPVDRPFARFREEDTDRPIIELLEHVVRRQPDRMAVADGEATLTYAELWRGLSGLAEAIAAKTMPGDLVGILLPTCTHTPIAMLACLAAGRPFAVMDSSYPREWLETVLQDSRPALVIDRESGFDGGASGTIVMHLDSGMPAPSGNWGPAELAVDQPACVLFTSGSTGKPKGIVNSQRNLLQRVMQSINAGHINAEDRLLTLASPCTIVGVRDIITALLAGASIRLIDPQRVGAREMLNVIRQEAVTILFAFPALLRSVAASSTGPAGNTLRLVRVGGDTMLWSDLDLIRDRLGPGAHVQLIYAATEAPMMQWFINEAFRGADDRIPIGYPLPGNPLAVMDEDGQAARPGEFGELVVGSAYVALGRWTNGQCITEESERAGASGIRHFHTGDLVRQRPDGLLERVGRMDRQVKIRGRRVDLDGVESMLRCHRFVRDVGAVARMSGVAGEAMLVAHVSPRHGAPSGLIDELRETMRSAPPAMRPARFYLAPEIPRLPNSKLDARALQELDSVRAVEECAAAGVDKGPAGRDAIAQTVAQAWLDILKTAVADPEDDFFDAGGDSLKAIDFTLAVEQALGRELPVTLINEASTFERFCSALRDDGATKYTPLVLLKAGDGLPPVFLIHGVGGNVTELLAMARLMAYSGPVIGIQARGLVGDEPPHASVEAMASDYLREMRLRQPTGPYYLAGYSFGGLVAFEIARQLETSGEEVGFLGLFDTMMSPVRWPLSAWLSIAWRRMGRFITNAGSSSRLDHSPKPGARKFATTRVLKVTSSALLASAKYRLGVYRGQVTLFSPEEREPGLPTLESIWRRHAGAVTIVETQGTHATMLSGPNAGAIADRLTRCLKASQISGAP
jgi:non-ribosomal peptide synthetase component F/thioesterase domain-containing protein/acyl carrier protein